MISVYNNEQAAPGPSNLTEIIYKRVRLIGMVVTEYFAISTSGATNSADLTELSCVTAILQVPQVYYI